MVCLLHCIQIGEDVRAAESVDRLLGVADQDQCGVVVKGPPQDLPLDGIGVLKLIDHDDAVAPPEPLRGGLSMIGIGQGIA
jgi:hypothetical protein